METSVRGMLPLPPSLMDGMVPIRGWRSRVSFNHGLRMVRHFPTFFFRNAIQLTIWTRIGSSPVRVSISHLDSPAGPGYICDIHRIPDISASTPLGQILQEPDGISKMYLRLQRAESRLESYMRHFPGVFFTQRTDLSFDYISPSFEKLLEFPIQRLLKSGSQFLSLIYEKDRDFFVRELRKHASNRSSFTLQYRVRRPKDGSVAYLTDVRSPVYSESGILLGYEGVWLDTTRQIIAERKLTSSAWKESLAMLYAGTGARLQQRDGWNLCSQRTVPCFHESGRRDV